MIPNYAPAIQTCLRLITTAWLSGAFLDRLVGRDRPVPDSPAGRMKHGVRDSRRGAGNADLADSLGADRGDVFIHFVHPGSVDGTDVPRRGSQPVRAASGSVTAHVGRRSKSALWRSFARPVERKFQVGLQTHRRFRSYKLPLPGVKGSELGSI